MSNITIKLTDEQEKKILEDIKKEDNKQISKINFKDRFIYFTIAMLFLVPGVSFFIFKKWEYTTQYVVMTIAISIIIIVFILIRELHSIYECLSDGDNNIKYDITIINMYVKVIKNLVIILGIISVLLSITLYIPMIKDIFRS
ncbi:hypothetical protein [Paraclostridium bifermentans]|uniref:hypothetical protein n=1 Tax=Paraclostridium bifermentans TaxID=1490 RepID=UPI00359C3289